jgi:hypothetical protein
MVYGPLVAGIEVVAALWLRCVVYVGNDSKRMSDKEGKIQGNPIQRIDFWITIRGNIEDGDGLMTG